MTTDFMRMFCAFFCPLRPLCPVRLRRLPVRQREDIELPPVLGLSSGVSLNSVVDTSDEPVVTGDVLLAVHRERHG
jgi:hypothetical protein